MATIARNHSDMDDHPYRATPASIAAAKAAAAAEREEARKAGIETDADGHLIIPELGLLRMALIEDLGIPLETRVACSERVSALVEEFGLQCVIRSVRCEAKVNGLDLRVIDGGKDRP